MISRMQASADELLLFLKKWESEAKRVVAAGVIQPPEGFRCVFKVSGLVTVDEKAATFSVGDLAEDFALCHISYLGVGYLSGKDVDWSEWSELIASPEDVEELIVLRNPDSSILSIYVLSN